jgi:hypothetical protein
MSMIHNFRNNSELEQANRPNPLERKKVSLIIKVFQKFQTPGMSLSNEDT